MNLILSLWIKRLITDSRSQVLLKQLMDIVYLFVTSVVSPSLYWAGTGSCLFPNPLPPLSTWCKWADWQFFWLNNIAAKCLRGRGGKMLKIIEKKITIFPKDPLQHRQTRCFLHLIRRQTRQQQILNISSWMEKCWILRSPRS